MGFNATLSQLAEITAAQVLSSDSLEMNPIGQGISTDSRQIQPGEVFLALRGDRFDGHQFVEAAIQRGAIAAIVDQAWDVPASIPLLVVKDTLLAYQVIARWWRDQFAIPVIAVTGSVGKTTTKELIAAVLGSQGAVLKTEANHNNEIGVPKTLLQLQPAHQFAVIEMGMRGPGEIALLTRIANPTIAVITNVGTAHIGRLGSEQAIAEAKCELLAELSTSGVAVLNHDNARLMATAKSIWNRQEITYGLHGGDVQGQFQPPDRLTVNGFNFLVPLPGEHNAQNYLAALAVARALHIDWSPLQTGISVVLPQGRAQRHQLPQDIEILDETYNAGVESMLAALRLLKQTPGKRHIAVLGTMKELGERSPDLHLQVGQAVAQLHLDYLFTLADPAEATALTQGAGLVPTEQFTDPVALATRLTTILQPGDRLLFKASRAVGLDQVVTDLCHRLSHS
jgi:UDP-N-acetylmuramoyl-tripeptide--D-alanyl-D-alanine ligase